MSRSLQPWPNSSRRRSPRRLRFPSAPSSRVGGRMVDGSCSARRTRSASRGTSEARGPAAFGGPGADVAGGENAGNARLEQVVGAGCVGAEDEAVGSACDGFVEPFRARLWAEEDEEE